VHVFAFWEKAKMCGLAIFRFGHLQVHVAGQKTTCRCMDLAIRAPEIEFEWQLLYLEIEFSRLFSKKLRVEIEFCDQRGNPRLAGVD
jgi:hypothetical protein